MLQKLKNEASADFYVPKVEKRSVRQLLCSKSWKIHPLPALPLEELGLDYVLRSGNFRDQSERSFGIRPASNRKQQHDRISRLKRTRTYGNFDQGIRRWVCARSFLHFIWWNWKHRLISVHLAPFGVARKMAEPHLIGTSPQSSGMAQRFAPRLP